MDRRIETAGRAVEFIPLRERPRRAILDFDAKIVADRTLNRLIRPDPPLRNRAQGLRIKLWWQNRTHRQCPSNAISAWLSTP